jgi:hypothetical protein
VPLLPNTMAWQAETRQRLDDPREWLRGAVGLACKRPPSVLVCARFPASLATSDPITSNRLLNSSLSMRRASLFPGSAYVFGVLKCLENSMIKQLDHTKIAMTGGRKFKRRIGDEWRVLRSCSTRNPIPKSRGNRRYFLNWKKRNRLPVSKDGSANKLRGATKRKNGALLNPPG